MGHPPNYPTFSQEQENLGHQAING